MNETIPSDQSPISLATYLTARREALLHIWRTACANDPSLLVGQSLSRSEFNDHAPRMLEYFSQQIDSQPRTDDLARITAEHGLHRWHKGYSLLELLSELNHLNRCLTAEISTYVMTYKVDDPAMLTHAYELAVMFGNQLISGSVGQYATLEQNQAAERAGVLQQALDAVTEMTRQRGQYLRRASHDLRGGLGVIQGAASLLDTTDTNEEQRASRVGMLRRNLKSVGTMLSQLTDLARLEAGQEVANLQPVDVGALLHTIVESTQALATERGLLLQTDGPESLPVITDAVLVQRIVQNLLLNALQYTSSGLLSVSWSREDNFRWTVSVQDTGVGMPANLADSLTKPLKPTTDTGAVLDGLDPEPPIPKRQPSDSGGEGIGLYIVKWLCQLLNATIDIETKPGQGTLVRVRLPMNKE